MKRACGRGLAALIVAAALMALAPAGSAAAACMSPAESRRAIASGEARPLNAVLRRERLNGDVVRADLCESGQRLFYQVTVLLKNGKLVNKTLPAN